MAYGVFILKSTARLTNIAHQLSDVIDYID